MTTVTDGYIVTRVDHRISNLSEELTNVSTGYLYEYVEDVAIDLGNALGTTINVNAIPQTHIPAMIYGTMFVALMYEMGLEPSGDISSITIDVITIQKNKDRFSHVAVMNQTRYSAALKQLVAVVGAGKLHIGNSMKRQSV